MDLTRFRDALGIPGEGVHFHVLGVAILDVLATILLGWLLGKLFRKSALYFIAGLFVLAEFLHYLFGVDTAVMKLLGV